MTKCETVMEQDCHSVQEDKCSWEMEQKCLTHPGTFVHYLNSGVVVLKRDFMGGNRKANAFVTSLYSRIVKSCYNHLLQCHFASWSGRKSAPPDPTA